jgi:hypothetical protein
MDALGLLLIGSGNHKSNPNRVIQMKKPLFVEKGGGDVGRLKGLQ